MSLTGTVADGDVDFAKQAAHITGGMPGLPGVSGELIIIHPYSYFRAYGQTTYTGQDDSTLPINPAMSDGPLYIVQQIVATADSSSLNPVYVGTEQEASGSAYHIRVEVSKKDINSSLGALNSVWALGSGNLDLWITYGDFQLERLEFSTSDPNAGAAAIRLVLSNWNSVPAIQEPPANQFASPAASY